MKKITLLCGIAAAAFVTLASAPASAQATRTWVSGVGDDANPCSRTAPCKTYAGAISKTATGGEINCLDPGGFGALTITKSISVVCDYTEGGVLASLVPGFVINAPAGSIVTLKGQDVEGVGTCTDGIRMVGVGVTLHVHKVQIRNCRGSGASGIKVSNSSGTAFVFVTDSYITDNGATGQNAGIIVRPTLGAQANVVVDNVKLERNTNGIFVDGAGGGGIVNVNVRHSLLSGNSSNGISVFGTGAALNAVVDSSMISSNAAIGATAGGAGAALRLGSNTIVHNVTGVSGGAAVQSFKNNQIVNNGTDGTPITAVNSGGNILN